MYHGDRDEDDTDTGQAPPNGDGPARVMVRNELPVVRQLRVADASQDKDGLEGKR